MAVPSGCRAGPCRNGDFWLKAQPEPLWYAPHCTTGELQGELEESRLARCHRGVCLNGHFWPKANLSRSDIPRDGTPGELQQECTRVRRMKGRLGFGFRAGPLFRSSIRPLVNAYMLAVVLLHDLEEGERDDLGSADVQKNPGFEAAWKPSVPATSSPSRRIAPPGTISSC